MEYIKINKVFIFFITVILMSPFFALAVNDVSIVNNTNFQLNTADTAILTTVVATLGGQVTNFDIQSNYIDITVDNLSSVTLTPIVGGQFLKVTKQSGSNNYTGSSLCSTGLTLNGTGATVILRLEVLANTCVTAPTPPVEGLGTFPTIPIISTTTTPIVITTTIPVATTTVNVSTLPYRFVFTRTLRFGSIGDEVKQLQIFLNNQGFLLAKAGNGSVGRETSYFGLLTKAALIKFQETYIKEILLPQDLFRGTGIFLNYSRKVANEILSK